MNFLRAIIGIVVVIILALLLGWTKNEKHPAKTFYSWLGAITVLLLLRFFL
jgi:hypothetical protein